MDKLSARMLIEVDINSALSKVEYYFIQSKNIDLTDFVYENNFRFPLKDKEIIRKYFCYISNIPFDRTFNPLKYTTIKVLPFVGSEWFVEMILLKHYYKKDFYLDLLDNEHFKCIDLNRFNYLWSTSYTDAFLALCIEELGEVFGNEVYGLLLETYKQLEHYLKEFNNNLIAYDLSTSVLQLYSEGDFYYQACLKLQDELKELKGKS